MNIVQFSTGIVDTMLRLPFQDWKANQLKANSILSCTSQIFHWKWLQQRYYYLTKRFLFNIKQAKCFRIVLFLHFVSVAVLCAFIASVFWKLQPVPLSYDTSSWVQNNHSLKIYICVTSSFKTQFRFSDDFTVVSSFSYCIITNV